MTTSDTTPIIMPKCTSITIGGVKTEEKYVIDTVNIMMGYLQRYITTGLAFSFNGGKDCTVLLYLLIAACEMMQIPIQRVIVIYLQIDDEFDEILAFIKERAATYHLTIHELQHYQIGLTELMHKVPISAILMGQRMGDPGTDKMDMESPSDAGWPAFMRLNPILHWTYAQVWSFLRTHHLPYCSLYDLGYTSLGTRCTTQPNPVLWDDIHQHYLPAYMLQDASAERGGRNMKKSSKNTAPPLPCTGDHIESKEIPATITTSPSSSPSTTLSSSPSTSSSIPSAALA